MDKNIKTTDWLTRGIPKEQLEREKQEAIMSADLELLSEDSLSFDELAKKMFTIGYCKQEWVSVDEKLPSEREWVICYSSNKKSFPIFIGYIGNYSSCWIQDSGHICMTPVTHWMPLPEAPKDGVA